MGLLPTVLLGAIAGFTILLGLPVARLRNLPRSGQAFLNALATGILVFLLWDILSKASEPITTALDVAKKGEPTEFVLLLALFVAGFGVGLLGLVYFDQAFIRRPRAGSEMPPFQLALMIAIGIGFHNFSEGLAIGQASRTGAIELATLLIVGFGLHNATEGFGIVAPLAGDIDDDGNLRRPSWRFLLSMGAIGGGPTFVGTIIGHGFASEAVSVVFLTLAAGSIVYVVTQLVMVAAKTRRPDLLAYGLLLGLVAGFLTDGIVTAAGV
jgi:ZIP family zinc transporter